MSEESTANHSLSHSHTLISGRELLMDGGRGSVIEQKGELPHNLRLKSVLVQSLLRKKTCTTLHEIRVTSYTTSFKKIWVISTCGAPK